MGLSLGAHVTKSYLPFLSHLPSLPALAGCSLGPGSSVFGLYDSQNRWVSLELRALISPFY